MNLQQHAILVRYTASNTFGLDDLNVRLQRGWRVVEVTALGGSLNDNDGCMAALVIIEREASEEKGITAYKEEEPQEIVEELSEGDGSGKDLPSEIQSEDNGGGNPISSPEN